MREIAHNWISSVRIKVNASRIAAATASAAQSEALIKKPHFSTASTLCGSSAQGWRQDNRVKDHAAARRTSARRTLVFETPASPTITMTQRPSGVMQTILAGLTIFSDNISSSFP
jgi:hypothetical protein